MITIYSTENCAYCKKAKKYLAEKQIPFREVDVSTFGPDRTRMIDKSHTTSVPQFEIDDRWIVGWADFAAEMARVNSVDNPAKPHSI